MGWGRGVRTGPDSSSPPLPSCAVPDALLSSDAPPAGVFPCLARLWYPLSLAQPRVVPHRPSMPFPRRVRTASPCSGSCPFTLPFHRLANRRRARPVRDHPLPSLPNPAPSFPLRCTAGLAVGVDTNRNSRTPPRPLPPPCCYSLPCRSLPGNVPPPAALLFLCIRYSVPPPASWRPHFVQPSPGCRFSPGRIPASPSVELTARWSSLFVADSPLCCSRGRSSSCYRLWCL